MGVLREVEIATAAGIEAHKCGGKMWEESKRRRDCYLLSTALSRMVEKIADAGII